MNQNPKKAVFILILVIAVIFGLSQLTDSLLYKRPTTSKTTQTTTPTPIPKTLTQFESPSKLFTFFYPSEWQLNNTRDEIIFKNCDQTVLSIEEISTKTPQAWKYLGVSSNTYTYSIIDDYKSILVSDSQTTPSAQIVIEATRSAKLVDINFYPTCNTDIETAKNEVFYELLKYFKFLD